MHHSTAQLSQELRRHHQKHARGRTELVGVLVVVTVGLCAATWMTRSAEIDVHQLTKLPAAFGFNMWSSHIERGHAGFAAPIQNQHAAPTSECVADTPTFVLGLAELRARLGAVMGEAVECERAVDAEGDTLQLTTTGLAAFVQSSQTVSFTDGWHHWALSSDALVSWEGDQPDDVRPDVHIPTRVCCDPRTPWSARRWQPA